MKQVLDYFCDTSPTIFESILSIFNHMSTKSFIRSYWSASYRIDYNES